MRINRLVTTKKIENQRTRNDSPLETFSPLWILKFLDEIMWKKNNHL